MPTGVPGPDIYQDWVGRVNLYLYFDLMNYVLQTSTGAASSDNPRLGLLSIMSLGEVVKPSQIERKEDCCGKETTTRKVWRRDEGGEEGRSIHWGIEQVTL